MNGPLRGNRTWQVGERAVREQLCGGYYRYWTPLGIVTLHGETGHWVLGCFDGTVTVPLPTLDACDDVVRDTLDQVMAEAGK